LIVQAYISDVTKVVLSASFTMLGKKIRRRSTQFRVENN